MRPVLADHHRLADVRAELQLVLDEGRREPRAVGEPQDVGEPVDHDQVAPVVHEARVPRAQPAVTDRLRRGLGILVVAEEDVLACDEDLAALGDAHARPRRGLAQRLGADIGVGVQHADARRLGLAVHLLEVEPNGPEEPEDLRAEGGAARVGVADAREAELVEHGPERQHLGETLHQSRAGAHRIRRNCRSWCSPASR